MARFLMWSVASVLVLVGGVALANKALGDLAPPEPPPARENKLVVSVDPNLQTAKLILPANVEERRFGAPVPEAAPREDQGAFWSPTRTMMAGLCLSLAVVSLLFVRLTSGGARMLLIGVVGVSALGLGAAAWADIPSPFPRPRPPQPEPIAAATKLAEGPVRVEYTGKAGEIRLVLTARSLGGVFRLPPGEPRLPPNFPAPGAAPAPPAP